MVNPYSNATVKRKGYDGKEYEVPAPKTMNSVWAGLAVSRAVQDRDYDAIATGPLSTFASAKYALNQAGYKDASAPPDTPSWVDGTSTPALPQENRRAPIVPIGQPAQPAQPTPSAILLTPPEDEASMDTKRVRGDFSSSNRTVVNRSTGRTREEEEDELLRSGAILLR